MLWHLCRTCPQQTDARSLVYLISAGASPVFGFLVDRIGRNILWVCAPGLLTNCPCVPVLVLLDFFANRYQRCIRC
jgi:MFS family permease